MQERNASKGSVAALLLQLACASACGARTADDGVAQCARFADEDAGPSLQVRVENHAATPVFLWEAEPLFSLADAAGGALALTGCVTCEDLQSSVSVCVDHGLPSAILRLSPGEAREWSLSGRFYAEARMPRACFREPSSAEACQQARALPEGELTVQVESWADAACEAPECGCAEAPDGSCPLLGSPNPVAGVTFSYPSAHPIVIAVGTK